MKRNLGIVLALLLLLTACGDGRKMAYGTVAEVQTGDGGEITAIVVDGDDGKQFGALIAEDTWLSPWGEGPWSGEEARAAIQEQLQPGTRIAVEQLPDRKELETAGGGKIRAYESYYISVTAILRRNAAELTDGTALDILDHGGFSGVTYCLPDGTELLWVRGPSGPENHFVGNLESFQDLSETAQEKVRAWYEERGLLYDEEEELEKAYAAYLEQGEDFQCHMVEQSIDPSASSEKVMYFGTHVTLPLDQEEAGTAYTLSLGEAFDRETGEHLSLWDLFQCSEEEARQAIIDAALDWRGSGGVRAGLEAAFDPERVVVGTDSLYMHFEPGIISEEPTGYAFNADVSKLKDLMYDWAVPESGE